MLQTLLNHLLGLDPWQIAALTTLALLQGAVFSPLPEEVVIVTLGLLYSRGVIPLPLAVLAIQAGLLPANALMVFLGRYLRTRKITHKGWLGRILTQKSLEATQSSHDTHKSGLVLITRFTPLVRGPVYLALGFSGFSLKRFVILDSLASCVQIPLLLTIGIKAGENSGSILDAYLKAAPIMGILFAMGITWGAYTKSQRARTQQQCHSSI